MTTVYVLIAIQFEERDLVSEYGETYRRYQRRVSMLVPRLWAPTGASASLRPERLHDIDA